MHSRRGRMRNTLLAIASAALLVGCAAAPSPTPQPTGGSPRTLLVDTDVAPDDLVAIAFLLAAPQVDIVAITVSGTGEAHCAGGVATVLGLLERLQAPGIPVACGRETPLGGDHAFPDAWRAGVDAGSGLSLPETDRLPYDGSAVELILASADAHAGLDVLTLGPLTNLAEALEADPGLADAIGTLTVMGGAVRVPGNVGADAQSDNAVAEWNIYIDPVAAATVVASGVQPRLVSLDGTHQVPVTPAFGQRVAGEARTLAAEVLADLFAALPFMTSGDYYLWDPLAAELAAGYSVGSFTPVAIEVEVAEGPESGFTRPIDGAPNASYLSSADRAAAEETLLAVLNGS